MSLDHQRLGLLQAIIEAPDANTPRLIFADWVSDNGEPAWGDFIRWHCALTTCFVGDARPFALFHTSPQDHSLLVAPCHVKPEIREAVLRPFHPLADHCGGLTDDGNLPFWHLQALIGRGFVEWLSLGGNRAVEGLTRFAANIFATNPILRLSIEEVYLHGEKKPITPGRLRNLLNCPELLRVRELDLTRLRFIDRLGQVLLASAARIQSFRAYDQLQSEKIRERLDAAFGARMHLLPEPEYLTRR